MSARIPIPDALQEAMDALAGSMVSSDDNTGPEQANAMVAGFIEQLENRLAETGDDEPILAAAEAQLRQLLMDHFKLPPAAAATVARRNVRRAKDEDPEEEFPKAKTAEDEIDFGEEPSTIVTGISIGAPAVAPSKNHSPDND